LEGDVDVLIIDVTDAGEQTHQAFIEYEQASSVGQITTYSFSKDPHLNMNHPSGSVSVTCDAVGGRDLAAVTESRHGMLAQSAASTRVSR